MTQPADSKLYANSSGGWAKLAKVLARSVPSSVQQSRSARRGLARLTQKGR